MLDTGSHSRPDANRWTRATQFFVLIFVVVFLFVFVFVVIGPSHRR